MRETKVSACKFVYHHHISQCRIEIVDCVWLVHAEFPPIYLMGNEMETPAAAAALMYIRNRNGFISIDLVDWPHYDGFPVAGGMRFQLLLSIFAHRNKCNDATRAMHTPFYCVFVRRSE